MDLVGWLSKYFKGVYHRSSREVQFPCPRCGHKSFYFNIRKKVGFCHHDVCHWKPSLEDLIQLKGHGPDTDLGFELEMEEEDTTPVEVHLPDGAEKLIEINEGCFETRFPIALSKVVKDRNLTHQSIYRHNFHIGNGRIYIPVYYEGKMVNYVGRAMWWLPYESKLRYIYCPGVKTSDYIFNWDSAFTWPNVTLVENTFNAVWLEDFRVTTNFGSSLSENQINLLTHSRAAANGTVTLLWDEKTAKAAEKAVKKLRGLGVRAAYAKINGQPDHHHLMFLHHIVEKTREAAQQGDTWVDYQKSMWPC